jgi:hypothetical protein
LSHVAADPIAVPGLLVAIRVLLIAATVPVPHSAAIDQALHDQPDWTRLVAMALHHRLASPLRDALFAADCSLVPEDLLTALVAHCDVLEQLGRAVLTELWDLLAALERAGVTAVPFKGSLLGELLFANASLRAPGDIDILIHPKDTRIVRGVLESRGYRDAGQGPGAAPLSGVQRAIYERFQCEYQFARDRDHMVVEPHWELSQRPLAIDVDYLGMLDRARPVTLCGRATVTLAPEDLLVALSVHGWKHQWPRLAWVRDVAGVLHAFPEIDLQRVLAQARARGYERLVLLSLGVARRYAGSQLPSEITRAIEFDRPLVGLMSHIDRRLFDLSAAEPRNDRIDGFRLRMRERWSDRVRYVIRTVTSPRRNHLETVDLPHSLRWGYYPLKLGIDYAILPAWNVLKHGKASLLPN